MDLHIQVGMHCFKEGRGGEKQVLQKKFKDNLCSNVKNGTEVDNRKEKET